MAKVFIIFGALAFWFGWAAMNSMIAKEKNRDVTTAFLASVFASPLLVYLYLLAVPHRPDPDAT
jgi:hypothetical protein